MKTSGAAMTRTPTSASTPSPATPLQADYDYAASKISDTTTLSVSPHPLLPVLRVHYP